MRKRILSAAALLLSCTIYAQTDTLRAVVNVNNEYDPVLIKVNKKSFMPSTGNDTRRRAPQYEFTSEAIPYGGFVSERNSMEMLQEQEMPYNGYARAGYGTANCLDLKLAYRRDLTARDNIRFAAAMDGFKTGNNGTFGNWDSRMYNSMADLGYTHLFNGLELGIEGDFNNRVFNYQKAGFTHNATDKQNSMNYGVRLKGASMLDGMFGYSFDAAFAHSGRKYSCDMERGIAEYRIGVGGSTWYAIDNINIKKVGIRISADAFLYNDILRKAMNPYENYVSVDIDPYIDFSSGGWALRLGTRMNILTANGSAFAIAPDIMLQKDLANNISIYAKATGGRTDNSFSRVESIAPYWGYEDGMSRQLKPTYRIVDATLGSTFTHKSLSVEATAGYAYTKDDLLQTMEISSNAYIYSNFVQKNTHNAHASARVGYDFGGWLKVSGDARYDFWECDNKDLLVMKPEITCNVNAELKFFGDLTVNAGYNFTQFTKSEEGKRVNFKNDVNLRLSYRITPRLGVYIQGHNLLNDNYYEYAGYETLGARGLLGVTANF